MRSGWRWRCGAVAALLLAGCSATQLAYNRIDILARWQLDHYVTLRQDQRQRFDQDFAVLWTWHRRQALPQYARELRELAGRVDSVPERAELERWSARYGELWATLLEHAAPVGCGLGPGLDETQVQTLLAGADKDLQKFAAKKVSPPESEQRARTERELVKNMNSWLGGLKPEQRQLLQRWNAGRPLTAAAWLDFRRRWRTALEEALAHRQQADFCPRLQTLLVDGDTLWTPEQRTLFAANRTAWIDLLMALAPSLDAEQRQHLRRRLLQLADEFDELSREKQPETKT